MAQRWLTASLLAAVFLFACRFLVSDATRQFFSVRSSGASYPDAGKAMYYSSQFAARALRPYVTGVLAVDREPLARLNALLRPEGDDSFSVLLHALPVFGLAGYVSSPRCGREVGLVELALDSDLGAKHFGGARALSKTRYGARFPLVHKSTGHLEPGAQAHPGQALAALLSAGVDPAATIMLPGGKRAELRFALDDLIANFSLEGEIYWDAVALSLALPPSRSWRNKFGQEFRFDDLANELLGRPARDSACLGIHRLISLTVLFRADRECPILSRGVRKRVTQTLSSAVRRLCAIQSEDGWWGWRWSEEAEEVASAFSVRLREDPLWRVVATGHHLEWLVLLPPDIRPPTSVYRRAAAWLYQRLVAQIDDRAWMRAWYCPISHAVRCLNALIVVNTLSPHSEQEAQKYERFS